MKYLSPIAILLSITSCTSQHKKTSVLCDKKLYIETFSNWLPDGRSDYLTDSANFRISIGEWDYEHEYFIYKCIGNTVVVSKIETGAKNCHVVTLPDGKKTVICETDTLRKDTFSLSNLKSMHNY